jgi:hypothetical protein
MGDDPLLNMMQNDGHDHDAAAADAGAAAGGVAEAGLSWATITVEQIAEQCPHGYAACALEGEAGDCATALQSLIDDAQADRSWVPAESALGQLLACIDKTAGDVVPPEMDLTPFYVAGVVGALSVAVYAFNIWQKARANDALAAQVPRGARHPHRVYHSEEVPY